MKRVEDLVDIEYPARRPGGFIGELWTAIRRIADSLPHGVGLVYTGGECSRMASWLLSTTEIMQHSADSTISYSTSLPRIHMI